MIDEYTKYSQYTNDEGWLRSDWTHRKLSADEWKVKGKQAKSRVERGKLQLEYSLEYLSSYLGDVLWLEQCREAYESATRRDAWLKGEPMNVGWEIENLPWGN